MSERPVQAALVALHALPAISDRYSGPIGGTETRAWLLARGLARYCPKVIPSMIVRGPADIPAEVDEVGLVSRQDRLYDWYVNVGRSVKRRSAFPPVSVERFDPRLIWQLPVVAAHRALYLKSSDPCQPDRFFRGLQADVFTAFGVQSTAATVIASAHATGRRCVVALGCDDDLDERYLSDPEFVNPYGDRGRVCRWILESADAILVQTEWQQRTLEERFGRTGYLLRNPIDLDVWNSDHILTGQLPEDLPGKFALWVGRAERVHKRPQEMVELARQCPDVPIVMVMNHTDPVFAREVEESAPRNVTFIERVSPEQMPALYSRATVLVNTSAAEGFPNAFLQAAAMKLPVLTLDVLGGFLRAKQLGWCAAGEMSALATMTSRVHASLGAAKGDDVVKEGGFGFSPEMAFRYAEAHHGLASIAKGFASVLEEVVRHQQSSRGEETTV